MSKHSNFSNQISLNSVFNNMVDSVFKIGDQFVNTVTTDSYDSYGYYNIDYPKFPNNMWTYIDTYIYPTMSVDKIHAINAAGQAYYIADMTGKLVSNGIFATTNEEISIASLRKGVYLLKTNHRVFKIIRL